MVRKAYVAVLAKKITRGSKLAEGDHISRGVELSGSKSRGGGGGGVQISYDRESFTFLQYIKWLGKGLLWVALQ